MKYAVVLTLCLQSLILFGQEPKPEFDGHAWEAPYHLEIPKDWTIERFLIPIMFAPQIAYKGVEDIRFAPGWGNFKSEEYWSYAFLWYLDVAPKTSSTIVAENLKAYYTGLTRINSDSAKFSTIPPQLKQVKTAFKEVKAGKGDLKTFTGTVEMLDYMQMKPIVLRCKAHLKACPETKKTILFYELSPQPYSHKIWKSLDKLWAEFSCKKQ